MSKALKVYAATLWWETIFVYCLQMEKLACRETVQHFQKCSVLGGNHFLRSSEVLIIKWSLSGLQLKYLVGIYKTRKHLILDKIRGYSEKTWPK